MAQEVSRGGEAYSVLCKHTYLNSFEEVPPPLVDSHTNLSAVPSLDNPTQAGGAVSREITRGGGVAQIAGKRDEGENRQIFSSKGQTQHNDAPLPPPSP